ncbi:MAG: glycosyltransferase family 4 protein [Candidatus Bathyarchaeia archaeon]
MDSKLKNLRGFDMHILLISQYFWPENVGAPIWIYQLATDLANKGHQVTVLTGFPNYPKRIIFEGYRGKFYMREQIGNINIIRTYIYASPNEALWSRALNFGSFCASAAIGGLIAPQPDVIYCILPPLPLGLSAEFLGVVKRAPVVINIQDIYPDIAIALGILRNPLSIKFFKWMERFIYEKAAAVVVISDGFKKNLMGKGIPPEKIYIVPNWADSSFIQPGPRNNPFRHRLGLGNLFTVIYSGNLSYNSDLDSVIEAAELLRNEPFAFVIVGDGVRKTDLQRKVYEKNLENVKFLPFQPLEVYPQVLAAADINLVTLNAQATMASVPSKVYKIMAAGKPVLAIADKDSEIYRLISEANCGFCVDPGNPTALAEIIRYAATHIDKLERMGMNGRRYLEEHFSRTKCVANIEEILQKIAEK